MNNSTYIVHLNFLNGNVCIHYYPISNPYDYWMTKICFITDINKDNKYFKCKCRSSYAVSREYGILVVTLE